MRAGIGWVLELAGHGAPLNCLGGDWGQVPSPFPGDTLSRLVRGPSARHPACLGSQGSSHIGGCSGLGWIEGAVEPEGSLQPGAEDLKCPEMSLFLISFRRSISIELTLVGDTGSDPRSPRDLPEAQRVQE